MIVFKTSPIAFNAWLVVTFGQIFYHIVIIEGHKMIFIQGLFISWEELRLKCLKCSTPLEEKTETTQQKC